MRGISNARLKQTQIGNRINSAIDKMFMQQKNRLTAFDSILTSTNPTRVLDRGYSMAINEEGIPVTSVVGLKSGDSLTVVLKDGRVQTEVKE